MCFEQCDDLPKLLIDHMLGTHWHLSVVYTLAKTCGAFRVAVRGAINEWCRKYTAVRDELIKARLQLAGFVAHDGNRHELGVWTPPLEGTTPRRRRHC